MWKGVSVSLGQQKGGYVLWWGYKWAETEGLEWVQDVKGGVLHLSMDGSRYG